MHAYNHTHISYIRTYIHIYIHTYIWTDRETYRHRIPKYIQTNIIRPYIHTNIKQNIHPLWHTCRDTVMHADIHTQK